MVRKLVVAAVMAAVPVLGVVAAAQIEPAETVTTAAIDWY